MKINIQKLTRVIPCLITIIFVLVLSAAPAFAYTFTGDWTFNKNITPPAWESVSITFTSNGVTYNRMVYEEYSEAYMVPLITFKSDTASRPAIYWRDGSTYFTDPDFQYIKFTGFQLDMNSVFSNWMLSSAQQGLITPDSEQAGQIKDNVDDAAGRLEDANDIWDQLPEPTLSGHEYDFLITTRPEYLQFLSFFQTAWSNSTLYEMMLVLGGLMLASFLIFAGK